MSRIWLFDKFDSTAVLLSSYETEYIHVPSFKSVLYCKNGRDFLTSFFVCSSGGGLLARIELIAEQN